MAGWWASNKVKIRRSTFWLRIPKICLAKWVLPLVPFVSCRRGLQRNRGILLEYPNTMFYVVICCDAFICRRPMTATRRCGETGHGTMFGDSWFVWQIGCYDDAVVLNTASLCGAAMHRQGQLHCRLWRIYFNPLSVLLWLTGIGREILRTRANHLRLRLATPQSPSGYVSPVPCCTSQKIDRSRRLQTGNWSPRVANAFET